jgi:hypothetical protein
MQGKMYISLTQLPKTLESHATDHKKVGNSNVPGFNATTTFTPFVATQRGTSYDAFGGPF